MSTAYGEAIGAELKSLRTTLGLTQFDVSESLGVSHTLISHWETGESRISFEHFMAICVEYGEFASDVLKRIEIRVMRDARDDYYS